MDIARQLMYWAGTLVVLIVLTFLMLKILRYKEVEDENAWKEGWHTQVTCGFVEYGQVREL